ncbi:MAG: hypothetical protein HYY17_12810 [Planctomycetes bacterium]|nr:hypothetical protein [Planctomycetota bacterium]
MGRASILFWGMLLPGCGIGVAILSSPAPCVTVTTPATVQARHVPIRYRLETPAPSLVSISVSYSVDGGTTFVPATSAACGDGVGHLEAKPGGVDHLFCWDSLADLGEVDHDAVRVRIACSNTGSAVTEAFACHNLTNTPPRCEVIEFESDQSRLVPVKYRLYDVNEDLCSIQALYSLDGATWFPCTPGPWGGGVGSLAADALGVEHVFTWDCAADLGSVDQSGVVVRVQPYDVSPGTADVSLPFRCNNVTNTPPHCLEAPITTDQSGHVPIQYKAIDVNNHAVSLGIDFSLNGGATWAPATPGPGGDGNGNLAASAEGVDHVFIWNSNADVAAVDVQVMMRLILSDGSPGPACVLGPFRCNNATNTPPWCALETVDATQSGTVPVPYTLYDPNSDPISIAVWYSTDGGLTFLPATPGTGGDGTGNLAASAAGVPHVFMWDSQVDLGATDVSNVKIRIVPSDAAAGAPATTTLFRVNNVSNVPPSCHITDIVIDQSGLVYVHYTLVDANGDGCAIVPQFSQDSGLTFAACAGGPGGDGVGGLAASSTGTSHIYVWDSLANLGATDQDDIRVRITPADAAPGTPDTTANFTVNNVSNTPPVADVPTPTGIQAGQVPIPYVLFDVNGDTCTIVVEFSQDGGLTFSPATPGAGGDGASGLAASSAGVSHIFVWNSTADIGSTDQDDIRIRIRPSDAAVGSADTTGNFTVHNVTNVAPSVVVVDPSSSQSGQASVEYALYDPNSDLCTLTVEYSADDGVTFSAATPGAGGDGTSGLASGPLGVLHVFVWNSLADIGGVTNKNVQIRIRPSDAAVGTADTTVNFTVNNTSNSPPIVTVSKPSGVQSGNVTISYKLKDVNSDVCSIVVEFSQDGGLTFAPATAGLGGDGTSGLTASAPGVWHTFVWNSAADLGPGTQTDIQIRITPSDGTPGSPGSTGNCTVSN